MERDSVAQPSPPIFNEMIAGQCYAARMNAESNWERVQLLGPSSIDADCFRVYSLDVGAFGIVRRHNFRFLRVPVGLRKVLLAKCKVRIFLFTLFSLIVHDSCAATHVLFVGGCSGEGGRGRANKEEGSMVEDSITNRLDFSLKNVEFLRGLLLKDYVMWISLF